MRNEDKWENSTNQNMIFFINDQNIMFGYNPPMKKLEKTKDSNQLILINVQNDFFIESFILRGIIYLAKIMRALLRNKNEILYFWKKSIIQ